MHVDKTFHSRVSMCFAQQQWLLLVGVEDMNLLLQVYVSFGAEEQASNACAEAS